jgi:hypothetical protein
MMSAWNLGRISTPTSSTRSVSRVTMYLITLYLAMTLDQQEQGLHIALGNSFLTVKTQR